MSHVKFREERCKGCLLCTTVCPCEIIIPSERFNRQGFKVVEIRSGEMENCKGCAFCAQICPDNVITVWRSKQRAKGEESHVAG
mgnify:CR=1 FL=1